MFSGVGFVVTRGGVIVGVVVVGVVAAVVVLVGVGFALRQGCYTY